MVNILYVSAFAHIGGGEISILTALKHLDRKKFKPFLICYAQGPFIEKAMAAGLAPAILKRKSFLSDPLIIWRLSRFIKRNNITFAHVNSLDIRAAIACWLAGIPFIGHLRVIYPFSWRDRLFVRLSSLTVAVSDAVIEEFCKNASVYKNKFIVIPNGVTIPDNIVKAGLKEEFHIPPDARIIGAVGRIDPMKGFEYFIEAAGLIKKEFPDSRFFIVGNTSGLGQEEKKYLNTLRKRVEELSLAKEFFFTGFREDILEVLASFYCLVVSSVALQRRQGKITEGFGRVAIEAMAVGVPVVASDLGGLKEIIEDGVSGMLVEPGNPSAIASAVITLLKDQDRADAIRKQARERFNAKYTALSHIKSLAGVYSKILGITMLDRPCAVCGSSSFEVLERCGCGYSVLECSACGFAFVEPVPGQDFIKKSYQEDYYRPWLNKQRQGRISMWKKRLKILNRFAGKKGSLLDVGCGEGLFLELAKADGWDAAGTELSCFAAKYAGEKLGFTVFEGELESIDLSGKKFDAVTLWHVLEHMQSPRQALKKIRSLIKDDGVLILALPNLDNKVYRFLYRLVKGKEQHLFSPYDRELHLNFFKKETIARLLEETGFRVSAVRPDYCSFRWHERLLNTLNSLFYFFGGRMFFDALEIHARPFNQTKSE